MCDAATYEAIGLYIVMPIAGVVFFWALAWAARG